MKNLIERLRQWLHIVNMIPCECGSRDDHWNVKDHCSGHVCEAEIICDDCGKMVNYWAYGSCEYPETYTDLIASKAYDVRLWLRGKFSRKAPPFL